MNNVFVAVHALISEGNNILLLKRSKDDDYQPGLWDIPGGTVEFGETIECALQREIMEEVGLQVEHISPLYIYTNNSELPQRQTFQIVMKCNLINDKNIRLNHEHSEYKWIKYDDLKNYECIAFLENLANTFYIR